MKRIVIIEGNVSSLHRFGETCEVRIDNDHAEVALPLTPEAADLIGAAFREPVRVVVEIGTEEIAVGSLASSSREELIHALAAARHAADEYRHESEGLTEDLAVARLAAEGFNNCAKGLATQLRDARNAVAFDPEKHITKATVCGWLGAELIVLDMCGNKKHAQETRATIDRINSHKDSP